jgi:OmpA-OmpF porin, OOP family
MASMLDSFRELASPAILAILTRQTNESESAIARGFSAAIPAIAATIANRSDDHDFMKNLTDLASRSAADPDPLKGIGRIASAATGIDTTTPTGNWLSSLFGQNLSGMVDNLASYAGIRGSSAGSILSVCAPLVLGYLGRLMRSENLSTAALADRLRGQRNQLASAVPLGFEMPEFFHAPYRAARTTVDETARRATARASRERETSWGVPMLALLGLLGLGGLIWWAGHQPTTTERARLDAIETVDKVVGTTGVTVPAPKAPVIDTTGTTGVMSGKLTRALPGNVNISIPAGGAEDRLTMFLASPAPGGTTINFDRIVFGTGSAVLSADAREQIANIATILRAYPNAVVTVAGFTDNLGKESANVSLSKARAEAVAGRLTANGVAADRVHAEGNGSQKPVADNSTEAGRAENRRVALEVNTR